MSWLKTQSIAEFLMFGCETKCLFKGLTYTVATCMMLKAKCLFQVSTCPFTVLATWEDLTLNRLHTEG